MADEGRRSATNRVLDESVLSFSNSEATARLKQEPTWQSSDRNAITLVKNPSMRVTLVALRKGASLREHHVEGPITVRVIEGSISFTAGANARVLKRDDFLALDRAIPHEVDALEECVLLLTIIQPH